MEYVCLCDSTAREPPKHQLLKGPKVYWLILLITLRISDIVSIEASSLRCWALSSTSNYVESCRTDEKPSRASYLFCNAKTWDFVWKVPSSAVGLICARQYHWICDVADRGLWGTVRSYYNQSWAAKLMVLMLDLSTWLQWHDYMGCNGKSNSPA